MVVKNIKAVTILLKEAEKDIIVKASKEERRSFTSFVVKSALDQAKLVLRGSDE